MTARLRRTGATTFVLMVFAVCSGWPVQHVVPGAYPHAVQDMIHHPSGVQVRAAGSVQAATIASASGTKNVAVIIVQFPAGNAGLISGSRAIVSVSTIQNYFNQMKNYYTEVSYGKLILNFVYFNADTATPNGDPAPSLNQTGVYTLPHPMEYYGCGDEGQGCSGVATPTPGANGNYLTRDGIIAARNGGHTGLVSNEAGGMFDALITIHAGNGNETSQGKNGDIWSIFYSQDSAVIGGQLFSDPQPQAAAAGFTEGDVDPETQSFGVSSPLGVMCHEFGHTLGLPDLYNTSILGGASVVGRWEIMDAGPYEGSGANPSHMGAWDKMTLGWVSPVVAGTRLSTALSYVETSPSMLKIPIQNGLADEYFLVEYRSHASGGLYDRSIPGDGLLVWHVDEAIASSRGINAVPPNPQNSVNTGIPHYGVSIVSADGSDPAANGSIFGNGSVSGNAAFGNTEVFTSPRSDNFNGQPSGISLVNISGVGSPSVSLQVANLAVTVDQTISRIINFPNPAGKGYAHPNGEWHTTLQMQATRPASDYQVNLYTLSGDLVRKVGKDDITLNVDRSADTKWVYEYVWDLKNGDGQMVAPGVYMYLFRADGKSKSGKAVVIR